jgi:hypothetical protein
MAFTTISRRTAVRTIFLGLAGLALGCKSRPADRNMRSSAKRPFPDDAFRPMEDAYKYTLRNIDHLKVLRPGERPCIDELYSLSVVQNGTVREGRPVVVSVKDGLPQTIEDLLKASGQETLIKQNLDEVVFVPTWGSFVGISPEVYDEKVRPGKRLAFIGLFDGDQGQIRSELDLTFSLIHETQHRSTLINVAGGIEPSSSRDDLCLYERIAEEKEIEAGLRLLSQDQFQLHAESVIRNIRDAQNNVNIFATCIGKL